MAKKYTYQQFNFKLSPTRDKSIIDFFNTSRENGQKDIDAFREVMKKHLENLSPVSPKETIPDRNTSDKVQKSNGKLLLKGGFKGIDEGILKEKD